MYKLAFLPAVVLESFTHTISLGTVVIGVLITIATLITMLFGVKYRVLADQQGLTIAQLQADRDTWKDIAGTHKEKIEELIAEKQGCLGQITDLKEDKARLEALPNLSLVLDKFNEVMARTEDASAKRHKELIDTVKEATTREGR